MYNYRDERSNLFTEEGQVLFLSIRDRVKSLLFTSGAVRMGHAISDSTGITWMMLACVDRMVELGELQEVTAPNSCSGQDRVFVSNN